MFSVVALLSWVFLEWENLAKCSIQLFREIALTVSGLTLPFSDFSCPQKHFTLSVNDYTLLMLSVSHFCLQLSIVCWNWAMIQGSVSFLFKLAAKYFSCFLLRFSCWDLQISLYQSLLNFFFVLCFRFIDSTNYSKISQKIYGIFRLHYLQETWKIFLSKFSVHLSWK